MACTQPEGVLRQEQEFFTLFPSISTYRFENEQLKFWNPNGKLRLTFRAAVIGEVTYLNQTELPSGANVKVILQSANGTGTQNEVVAETVITNPGQLPVDFVLTYDYELIDPLNSYQVDAEIMDNFGNLMFGTPSGVSVITAGYPSILELLVEPAGEG
jgi:uncharacterized lipoprotein YbaY